MWCCFLASLASLLVLPSVYSECRKLVAPTNGWVDGCVKETCKLNSTAKFSCAKGYKVNGPTRVKCIEIKNSVLAALVNNAPVHVWNVTEPSCDVDENHCAGLKPPANGALVSNCSANTICNVGVTSSFKCNEGFQLNGATAIVCQKVSKTSSQWSGAAPSCVLPGNSGSILDQIGAGNSFQSFLSLLLGSG